MKFSAIASALALACLVGGTTLVLASASPAAAAAHKGGKVVKTSKAHKGGKKSKVVTGGYN